MPATTPSSSQRWRGSSRGPKKRGSITARGRAPMVKMSRRIPPTPVAAPWWGSMAEGWLWLSMRMASGDAVAGVDHAGVLARPDQHPLPLGGQPPEVDPGGLVGAVLAPHHRIEGQLEVVGLAPKTASTRASSSSVRPRARCSGSPEGGVVGHGRHRSGEPPTRREPERPIQRSSRHRSRPTEGCSRRPFRLVSGRSPASMRGIRLLSNHVQSTRPRRIWGTGALPASRVGRLVGTSHGGNGRRNSASHPDRSSSRSNI